MKESWMDRSDWPVRSSFQNTGYHQILWDSYIMCYPKKVIGFSRVSWQFGKDHFYDDFSIEFWSPLLIKMFFDFSMVFVQALISPFFPSPFTFVTMFRFALATGRICYSFLWIALDQACKAFSINVSSLQTVCLYCLVVLCLLLRI